MCTPRDIVPVAENNAPQLERAHLHREDAVGVFIAWVDHRNLHKRLYVAELRF
jgi:hypothetical protein